MMVLKWWHSKWGVPLIDIQQFLRCVRELGVPETTGLKMLQASILTLTGVGGFRPELGSTTHCYYSVTTLVCQHAEYQTIEEHRKTKGTSNVLMLVASQVPMP
eukprot:3404597-Amphidinium_carterae.3